MNNKIEIFKHPSHRELDIRICSGFKIKPTLVISLWKITLRIPLTSNND